MAPEFVAALARTVPCPQCGPDGLCGGCTAVAAIVDGLVRAQQAGA